MSCGRRGFFKALAGAAAVTEIVASCGRSGRGAGTNPGAADAGTSAGAAASRATGTDHEKFMRLAIERARGNPAYPFGAVIVDSRAGKVLAGGVNAVQENPVLHGEMVALFDYVRLHGNRGWNDLTLYSTAELCSMCMSAMAWADLPRVVWGSSIKVLSCTGIDQIALPAKEVAARARSFYTPDLLLGGVLARQTDRLFQQAQQLREGASGRPSAGVSCQ